MKAYFELIVSFFKTGLFTFGGGLAMLPIIKAEIVDKRKWITEEELFDFYTVSQCTPGIIVVNTATFCGYRFKGFLGAVTATIAVIAPSILVITLIAALLNNFMDNSYLSNAFVGIRLGICALLLNLSFDLCKKNYAQSNSKKLHLGIFLGACLLLFVGKFSAVAVVIFAVLVGLMPNFRGLRKSR